MVLAALALLAAAGCSGGDGADQCDDDADCSGGERCVDGACQSQEADADTGGSQDADVDDGEDSNNDKPDAKGYYISYTLTDGNAYDLMVYATGGEEHTRVTTGDRSCETDCWLSDSLEYMVWRQPRFEEEGYDVVRIELDEQMQASEDSNEETLASGVSNVRFDGEVVSYERDVNDRAEAHYRYLDGGRERRLGPLEDGRHKKSWYIDSEAERVLVYEPGDRELNLSFGELGDTISGEADVTIDGRHYPDTDGSFYGSSMPVAFSDDGDIAAFATEAPVEYERCESDEECSGPGQRCGPDNTCTAVENTVHFVDTDELDELGAACDGPGTCSSDVHECYMPDGREETDTATCRPRPVSLGLSDVNDRDNCAETEGKEDRRYTSLRGPLSFDDRDNLYVVGERDCDDVAGGELPHTDIVRIDPNEGEQMVVWGNTEGGDLDLDDCWDPEAGEPSGADCQPHISSARLMPEHDEFAVAATNPWVTNPDLADEMPGLWIVPRSGEEQVWAKGEASDIESIEHVDVHPMP